MNDAFHQLLQLILQGLSWFLRTLEKIWIWSWTQIMSVFHMSWDNMPAWKIILGLIFLIALAAILVMMLIRGLEAFRRIARAFWAMAVTVFGVVAFVAIAGLFSLGFQWVVTNTPNTF
jgi:hypothetical protein